MVLLHISPSLMPRGLPWASVVVMGHLSDSMPLVPRMWVGGESGDILQEKTSTWCVYTLSTPTHIRRTGESNRSLLQLYWPLEDLVPLLAAVVAARLLEKMGKPSVPLFPIGHLRVITVHSD